MSTMQRVRQKTTRRGFAALDLVALSLVVLSPTAVAAFAGETGQWAHCPEGTALVNYAIVPNEEIPGFEVAICSVDGSRYVVTTDLNIFDGILLDGNFMQDIFVAALGVIQGKGLVPHSMEFTDHMNGVARRTATATVVPMYGGPPLTIRNYLAEVYAERDRQQEAQRQQALEQQQAAKKQLYEEFVKTNGITAFLPAGEIAANPFRFEGQVIGMRVRFTRMEDRTIGVFMTGLDEFIVNGVPSTMFAGGEVVALAARVKGRTGDGATSLEYVGSHLCSDDECSDLTF